MIPRYLRKCVELLLELTVILMFVFSTSSLKQCGPKTIVTIRNVGIKLCQLKCIEHGLCGSFEYDIETLTCLLSKDESKKTAKEGDASFSKIYSDVPTGSCASKTCSLGQRCLTTRSGNTVCVQDEKQNYPDRSLQHKIDGQENNPLHDACRKGDLGRVRCILSRGLVDVDGRDEKHERTPLMVAAEKGHRKVFDFLIRKGANVSQVDGDGNSILHWACRGGHMDMVKYLLSQHTVDIHSRGKFGSTPLMKAVYHGHRDMFKFLVSQGANVSQVDDDGDNILHWACIGGHVSMVKYLLSQHIIDINSRSKKGKTPLMKAVYYGQRDVLKFLVSKGANVSMVDDDGDNILHWACIGGHVSMVKYLLSQHIIDINSRAKKGTTPLMKAVYYGHRDVLEFLVSKGANVSMVDDDGDNIIHYASIRGQVEVLKHIITRGIVNIRSRGKNGRTPLMRSAYYGNRKVFDLLVSEGGRISSLDNNGNNILHLATLRGRVEMVKHILSQNMTDINSRNMDGETAAMIAMRKGHPVVYDFLVSRGCSL